MPQNARVVRPPDARENSAYESAYNLFRSGDYSGAILQFETFLEHYPVSSLAPGASYWIGNASYVLRDFQKAINTQKRLIRAYPDSGKVPDALLNIASSQQGMEDDTAAKVTLTDLIAKHPFSDAAQKAKRRLDNL
jgi:tol-pal system protein YbgF